MTGRPEYPRSTCCIAGCKSWSRRFPGEWMCARHWRMLPAPARRALRARWKRQRILAERYDDTHAAWTSWRRSNSAAERLWAHAKRTVVLAEAGL